MVPLRKGKYGSVEERPEMNWFYKFGWHVQLRLVGGYGGVLVGKRHCVWWKRLSCNLVTCCLSYVRMGLIHWFRAWCNSDAGHCEWRFPGNSWLAWRGWHSSRNCIKWKFSCCLDLIELEIARFGQKKIWRVPWCVWWGPWGCMCEGWYLRVLVWNLVILKLR